MKKGLSLVVTLPEQYDEKTVKELKSSLDNLLHDCMKEIYALSSRKKQIASKAGIQFNNGQMFLVTASFSNEKSRFMTGIVKNGMLTNHISYEDALIINKYALELSMMLKKQRAEIERGEKLSPAFMRGEYSLPSSSKVNIYKSRDGELHFPQGEGHASFAMENDMEPEFCM
jgi:hypothetical protein